MLMAARKRIAVIGCGGTISSIARSSLDVLDYPETGCKLAVGEVLARTPELDGFAECVPIPLRAVGSSAVGPQEWRELAELVGRTLEDDPETAGFVLPHGTGTLEETAYALHLVLKTDRPVVLVGAQRPASAVSSDAGMNLVAAVRTATCEAARGLGVLVVLNDEIHGAREVTKTSTYRLHTFRSPDFGALGHVDGDAVVFYRSPTRRHTETSAFDIEALTAAPRVDVAYSYAGADGAAVEAFVAAGAKGIVSAGFAPGIPAPREREALERAARAGVVVVQASRVGSGRVARRAYLREQGIVGADNLNPQKARILLSLALTKTGDPEHIQGYFDTH
jgi:L-asparaginase